MLNYQEQFNNASSTGRQVLILKAVGVCDCYDEDDLLNSEPMPSCEKCFGTGKMRLQIKTEKIRYEITNNSASSHLEEINYSKDTHELYSFYFPGHYHYINNDDIIIVYDEQGKPSKAFEVLNKENFVKDDFVFYEVFGKKVSYFNMEVFNERS